MLTTVTVAVRPSTTTASGAGVPITASRVPLARSESMMSPDTSIAMLHTAITVEPTTAYGARSDRPACSMIASSARVNSGVLNNADRSAGPRSINIWNHAADRKIRITAPRCRGRRSRAGTRRPATAGPSTSW